MGKPDPAEYIKQRCTKALISHKELMAGVRRHDVSRLRQRLCVELNQVFGLSATRIGHLLGGRDHTTVIAAWRKFGHAGDARTRRRLTDDERDRLFELHAGGMSVADIARAIGCSHAAASTLLRPDVMARRVQNRREGLRKLRAANAELRAQHALP
ncbi:transposase-like protein [Rhizobium azooxidifex]|uniref:Transposase-like protein n=1 Tax=Mycoplana azooxidifex TaxID=1636188 RepID=A0A7W6GLF9_9HYPH|nr:transposase-like protein [Mycoplana azooxidifex]